MATLQPLANEAAGRGFTHEIVLNYFDLSEGTAATAENVDIANVTGRLTDVALYVEESFEGGTVSDFDIAVGTTADPDLYVDETDSFGGTAFAINSGTALATAKSISTYDSGATLRIQCTPATGANDELTQGKARIRLNLISTTAQV